MTTNAQSNSMSPLVRLPLIQTGLIALVVCVVCAIVGGLISQSRGGAMSDGVWTLIATIPGVLIPMGILMMMPPKEPGAWSVPVLGGTMVRALTVLTIGMAVYMLIGPAKVVFFLTLLVALMITLVIDVTSVLSLIQRHPSESMSMGDAEGVS